MFDGGTFLLFSVLGTGTMIYGLISDSILAKPMALLSILAFMFLAFSMLQPQPVGITTNSTTIVKNYNVTGNTIMSNSTDTNTSQQIWIGSNLTRILPWIFFGFSFIPVYFLARTTFPGKGGKK